MQLPSGGLTSQIPHYCLNEKEKLMNNDKIKS